MSLYTKESIERVKDAVDMVALVTPHSDLRRVGARYTGLCPFHDERTPSFSVDADHKLYHCFGCGESGDAIRFVERTDGLDFKEAVELLAERHGVELKREREDPESERRRRRRERLLSLLERATAYYERYLWESDEAAPAREYLAGRGLAEATLREFRVGYAPSAWDRVLVAAQRDGFRPDELIAAGLAQRGRQGGVYDRFRARVTFPLADARGRVLGFGARALRPDQRPKYVNTSENELYHKGRQLFGISAARSPAARSGRIVVVEGYTDVLALHQAGLKETVAIMGTALTDDQLAELGRAAKTVYLALDADAAGQEAMLRASQAARRRGLELLVVGLPDGADPADLVAADGAPAFMSLLDGALSVPEFEVRRILKQGDLTTTRGRDRALAAVLPIVASVPANTATRDELENYVSNRLNLPPENVHVLLATGRPPELKVRRAAPPEPYDAVGPLARPERTLLAMCIARPDPGREYLDRLEPAHFSSDQLRRVRDRLFAHWDDPLAALPDDDAALSASIKDVVMRADQEDVTPNALRLTFLQLEQRRIEQRLRQAEEQGDEETQRSLAPARQAVRTQIDELMGLAL
jgi:DNA primase